MGSGQEFGHELPQIHITGATDHGMPAISISQLSKRSIEVNLRLGPLGRCLWKLPPRTMLADQNLLPAIKFLDL